MKVIPRLKNQLTLWQAVLGERLGGENLGSRYDPSSRRRARAYKKNALPYPCGRPVPALQWATGCDASDRHEDYLSVCRS